MSLRSFLCLLVVVLHLFMIVLCVFGFICVSSLAFFLVVAWYSHLFDFIIKCQSLSHGISLKIKLNAVC